MNPLRLLLVDDHEIFLEGLANLLSTSSDIEIIGKAFDGAEAFEFLQEQQPDILLTDLNMPKMNGIELVRKVKEHFPEIKILVLTMHNDRPTISEIMMAEAEGYVLKNSSKKELLTAIEKIGEGSTYYSNEVMSILLERIKKEQKKLEAEHMLTERELEILELISQEKSSREIAEDLFISIRTVDTHRKNLLKKANANTVIGLLKFGVHYGLVSMN
jgi:DNA-binding NarL/FixJ family response regulator